MTVIFNHNFNSQAPRGQCLTWLASLVESRSWLSVIAKRLYGGKEGVACNLGAKISAEMLEIMKADGQQRQKEAHAAALAGTGSMPYDRNWHEAGCNFELLIEQAEGINWYVANELLEITEWALASPQGQRALALQDDPTNPGGETLSTLLELRDALTYKVREELLGHIGEFRRPDTPNALLDELEESLCA